MSSFTFTDRIREISRPFLLPIVNFLARLKIPPNAVSLAGFLGCAATGVAIAFGYFQLAGLLLLIFGPLDAIDGLLARSTGKKSIFGAFFDSTLDRYAEIAIFGGFLYFAFNTQAPLVGYLAFAALCGSLMVSYTRARAEALGLDCKVGLLTRFERLALLTGGLLLDWFVPVLAILAVFANITALQRIFHVWRQTKS
ncbi:CDP-alcohol phosphatidyltransferase [Thermodesulfatator indicus DSM 15286]|uniref:CDP-alcohol phosphatidyltransferase n=1 Tax=Thermodesulfatator indicus (strain DSM 15286 / JCM 11887 / CIR29812) TaxID=667014 RepID=F8A8A1_THEID|nr:CDP-alcohol phosphatidyltransferase family protein [Thermodesulfatator indicus]AEH44629.1 CDP-alcohol phosphatidyltransferase [Thermodesulfatator indicus DSM 15286]